MNSSDLEFFVNIFKRNKIRKRIMLTKLGSQTLLEEFINFWYSKEHRLEQLRVAEDLKRQGKNVLMEKFLTLNGIRFRPDISFLEDGRWNIIEIEHGGGHKNNIFKNYESLSKIANIKVIDIKA